MNIHQKIYSSRKVESQIKSKTAILSLCHLHFQLLLGSKSPTVALAEFYETSSSSSPITKCFESLPWSLWVGWRTLTRKSWENIIYSFFNLYFMLNDDWESALRYCPSPWCTREGGALGRSTSSSVHQNRCCKVHDPVFLIFLFLDFHK